VADTPLGFLLTFSTYGSWLHGDPRGSKDRQHNTPGTDPRKADEFFQTAQAEAMGHPPVAISARMRSVLQAAFRETCGHRGWQLVALNIRTQHVHAVVLAGDQSDPERMLNDLKAYGTRALRRHGLVVSDARVWARHGSTRWLWHERDIDGACEYVLNWQGRICRGAALRRAKTDDISALE